MDDESKIVKDPVIEGQVSDTKEPGSKTDSALLLEKLQTEREKRRVAEDRTKILEEQLETLTASGDRFSKGCA